MVIFAPWVWGLAASTGVGLVSYMKGQYDAYKNPADTGFIGGVVDAPVSAKSFSTFNLVLFAIVGAVGLGLLREVKFIWGK